MSKSATIDRVIEEFASHMESVRPGEPFRISEAATAFDCVWQGDLCIGIVDEIPVGYMRVNDPKEADKQLVPGNTIGARHCLDSLEGITLFRPVDWNEESLRGPACIFDKERAVTHMIHGDVTIPAGFVVLFGYQREYDSEQRRERRARD